LLWFDGAVAVDVIHKRNEIEDIDEAVAAGVALHDDFIGLVTNGNFGSGAERLLTSLEDFYSMIDGD